MWGEEMGVHVSACSLTGSTVAGARHDYLCDLFYFVLLKEKKGGGVKLHVSTAPSNWSDEGMCTGVTQGYFTSQKNSSALCVANSVPHPLRT